MGRGRKTEMGSINFHECPMIGEDKEGKKNTWLTVLKTKRTLFKVNQMLETGYQFKVFVYCVYKAECFVVL